MSERPKFHPHEVYENFQKQIPHHKIGFRGQQAKYMETTVQNGFDRPRYFAMVNLHMSWREMRKRRTDLIHSCFNTPISYGNTVNKEYTPETIGDSLNYYQQYPERYVSLLLLDFKGLRGWWYTSFPIFTFEWNRRKLPKQMIAGVLTLDSEDFSDVFDKLSKKPEQLEVPNSWLNEPTRKMEKLLRRKLIRKALKAIVELNKNET